MSVIVTIFMWCYIQIQGSSLLNNIHEVPPRLQAESNQEVAQELLGGSLLKVSFFLCGWCWFLSEDHFTPRKWKFMTSYNIYSVFRVIVCKASYNCYCVLAGLEQLLSQPTKGTVRFRLLAVHVPCSVWVYHSLEMVKIADVWEEHCHIF
jgi:hypothetical protein